TTSDPLVHHGRHFGRTVFAFSNMQALLLAGLVMDEDQAPETQQERQEHRAFRCLLRLVPGLQERLGLEDTDADTVIAIANLLQIGVSSARSDDTKSLKGVIIDWITPVDGEPLRLARNSKVNQGFNNERTGFLLCPAGMDWSYADTKQQLKDKTIAVPGNYWPIFVYRKEKYDSEDPWKGLFRSWLLVSAYKHIFTSPSSVDDDPKATRSGNTHIHGMTSVTPASIAYISTQICFALSSTSVFCRTDKEMDSEAFYTSILELFEDPEEQDEVKDLLAWWNCQIFPSFSNVSHVIPANSALSKIKAKRAAVKATSQVGGSN
ncbi:hypothetical protein FA13DRAFT_1629042, partial [Coprinellus micaceus]